MIKRLIFLQGGLGNQMFQYAFYRYLKLQGVQTSINSESPGTNCHNGYELERIFPRVKEELLDRKSNSWFTSFFLKYLAALRYRIKFPFPGLLYEDKNNQCNTEDLLHKRIYIGFFQKTEFSQTVRHELLRDFSFRDFDATESEAIQLAQEIQNCPSAVSIHVRRGDYMLPKYYQIYGSVCSIEYYKKALQYMQGKIENPRYYVFSDDPQWVKENLGLDDATYVSCNTKEYSFRDMQLMSLCKHHVIANSSFSWWGAWLNPSPDKFVLAPDKWFNRPGDTVADEILPELWTRIRTQAAE